MPRDYFSDAMDMHDPGEFETRRSLAFEDLDRGLRADLVGQTNLGGIAARQRRYLADREDVNAQMGRALSYRNSPTRTTPTRVERQQNEERDYYAGLHQQANEQEARTQAYHRDNLARQNRDRDYLLGESRLADANNERAARGRIAAIEQSGDETYARWQAHRRQMERDSQEAFARSTGMGSANPQFGSRVRGADGQVYRLGPVGWVMEQSNAYEAKVPASRSRTMTPAYGI